MPEEPATQEQLLLEMEDLAARLNAAEETLRAIRSGEVDALMVSGAGGDQLFTLKGADRSYRILIEDMNEGALTLTPEGVILYANRRFAEMLKTPLEKVIGSTIHTWIAPDSRRTLQSLLRKGIDATRRVQLAFAAGDGTETPVSLSASNLDIDELPVSFCLVATDLTEQIRVEAIAASEKLARELLEASKQARLRLLSVIEDQRQAEEQIRRLNAELEQRVRDRTIQLEVANKELDAFASSVSHDLRAPLRALDGFSALLLAGYADKLDEQGRHCLDRIQVASRRMGQLINDLLGLARITRADLTRQPADLSALAREIATDLQTQDPQRRAEFVIAAGMLVQGDAHLLRIALENLLSNAWKFTGQRPKARIEFGVQPAHELPQSVTGHQPAAISGHQAVYFVRDNGVGFDMAYAGKLFIPFQRLHEVGEFPGTGIGLATVQRIISRHGGRIWPEAAVNEGVTFYFTLGGE